MSATTGTKALALRYGTNPHQGAARVFMAEARRLPIEVLNGAPGYINLLDALNGWQLVRELRQAIGLPAAASFKHVSPAGAAVGTPLSDALRAAYFVGRRRALGAGKCLRPRPRRRSRVVVWRLGGAQRAGRPEHRAAAAARSERRRDRARLRASGARGAARQTRRQVHGAADRSHLRAARASKRARCSGSRSSRNATAYLPEGLPTDSAVAQLVLKYTQSNSICLALDGQAIGIGAGQQSRIHCTRIACDKADLWYLRQHPSLASTDWPKDRVERDNAIDEYVRAMPLADRRAWLDTLGGVTLGSDAFIPFRDNVDRAAQSGVAHVIQPGGGQRSEDVEAACRSTA